jgi:septum formation topological specificity factor MinE
MDAVVELKPEAGVEIPPQHENNYNSTYEKARVACQTALQLNQMGMPIEVDEDDELFAQQVFSGEIPKPTTKQIFKPGVAVKLGAILEEYDVEIAKSSAQLRTVATNKLIELIDDPDPKVRLKAVEMIGKIADVGLFAERTEITITTKSTEELEKELMSVLKDYVDVEAKEVKDVDEVTMLLENNSEEEENQTEQSEETQTNT